MRGDIHRSGRRKNTDRSATDRCATWRSVDSTLSNRLAGTRRQLRETKCSPQIPTRSSAACVTTTKSTSLTHLNDALLAQLDLPKLESFWFPAIGQVQVQGFLIKPPAFDPDKKYPVKFLIHGGPQGAWGDSWSYRWNAELLAANGYVVIMINPRGSTGYGQAFVDGVNGDWGGKPFIDLMRGLDYAEQHYPFIDKTRECALGASYGGYMANWILGHTDRFKCIVTHDGMFNPESAYGSTEELWFNEWEFKGKPWDYYGKRRPLESLSASGRPPYPQRTSRRQRSSSTASSTTASTSREGFQLFTTLQRLNVPSEDALLPRRRPLGPQAAKLPALVQDRQRLGRPVHKARPAMSFLLGLSS